MLPSIVSLLCVGPILPFLRKTPEPGAFVQFNPERKKFDFSSCHLATSLIEITPYLIASYFQSAVDTRVLVLEVAERHDIILKLKNEVNELEEKLKQMDNHIHFKDEIIKDLRKERNILSKVQYFYLKYETANRDDFLYIILKMDHLQSPLLGPRRHDFANTKINSFDQVVDIISTIELSDDIRENVRIFFVIIGRAIQNAKN